MAVKTMTLGELKNEIAYAEENRGFTDDTPVMVWDRDDETFYALDEAVQEDVEGKMLELHVHLEKPVLDPFSDGQRAQPVKKKRGAS